MIDRGLKRFAYIYDFGDNWEHALMIEAIGDADPDLDYRALSTAGAALRRQRTSTFPLSKPISRSWLDAVPSESRFRQKPAISKLKGPMPDGHP